MIPYQTDFQEHEEYLRKNFHETKSFMDSEYHLISEKIADGGRFA